MPDFSPGPQGLPGLSTIFRFSLTLVHRLAFALSTMIGHGRQLLSSGCSSTRTGIAALRLPDRCYSRRSPIRTRPSCRPRLALATLLQTRCPLFSPLRLLPFSPPTTRRTTPASELLEGPTSAGRPARGPMQRSNPTSRRPTPRTQTPTLRSKIRNLFHHATDQSQ